MNPLLPFSSFPRRPLGGPLRDQGGPTTPLTRPSFALHDPLERFPEPGEGPREKKQRVMGLDLGQAVDPAAAAVVETLSYDDGFVGPQIPRARVVYLRVWPLGYDYTDLVRDVLALGPSVIVPDYGGTGRSFVDLLYREAKEVGYRGKIAPIQSASSNAAVRIHTDNRKRQYAVVPKLELVTMLRVAQQRRVIRGRCRHCGGGLDPDDDTGGEGRPGKPAVRPGQSSCPACAWLALPRAPETDRLLEELKSFRLSYTGSANQTMEHRGKGHHGDLVIALGLSLWYLSRGGRQLVMR